MAKVKGPLLSMRASGSIAKTNVFASWRGIPYARIHVVPTDPNTSAQQLTRNTFRWLNDLFRNEGPIGLTPWLIASEGRPFTDRNSFIKNNLPQLRTEVDLALISGSPGAKGGPAMAGFTAVTGAPSGQINVTWTGGVLPSGWTIQSGAVVAVKDQSPQNVFLPDLKEAQAFGPVPAPVTISSLTAATAYAVMGWLVYTRDDGTLAVSPGNTIVATSSA